MKNKIVAFFFFLLFFSINSFSQEAAKDSTTLLSEVIVKAYAYNRPALEIPAAIGFIDSKLLNRFNNTNLLPAVNTIPGVRFEERSPGSYRLSIRGSSLRSPFGIRNVKMYWNGLPLTDGGGNTYLNLIDFDAVDKLEIIKGPGASLYGAGTGGVVLLSSAKVKSTGFQFSTVAGGFGLIRHQGSAQIKNRTNTGRINYAHQQATGYREQSNLTRDGINLDWSFDLSSKSNLATTFLYSDLFYQTPGGLTKSEYDLDPSQARPTVGASVGAIAKQARVSNKTSYVGLMHEYQFNERWVNRTGVYGSYTAFVNPAIRNFEIRKETNYGARSETAYSFGATANSKLTFGGEYQYFTSPVTNFDNNFGTQGNLQADDKIGSTQALIFGQTDIHLPHELFFTLGASVNALQYRFERLSDTPPSKQTRNFNPVFSPRIALLKKMTPTISIYGSYSQGFSTPTLAEVRPSTNTYNNSLYSEQGDNLEAGIKGSTRNGKLAFELVAYQFNLNHAIVIQRTPDGADFYINSGGTQQRGLEASVKWLPTILNKGSNGFNLWTSYTLNPYKFENYVTTGKDYSGNQLTGTAINNLVTGIDFSRNRFYMNATFNYTSSIALNDANTDFANEYYLFGARVGYKINHRKLPLEFFSGIDNAFNQRHSLGNDLNATGGRYYNAAAGRGFYVGIKVLANQ
jgi:iron complex outermembrane receptor protein